jgi:YfiH family protein
VRAAVKNAALHAVSAPEARGTGDGGAWRLEERGGLLLATCSRLQAIPGVGHAFSTRVADGRVDFDLGDAVGASHAVRERRRRLLAAVGLGGRDEPTVLRQEHGATVLRSRDAGDGPVGDAAVWVRGDRETPAPAVKTADCVPILLAHRGGRAAAAIHAGWRGTALGIAGAVVRALAEAGIEPVELVAAVGPAIRRCCYEVENAVLARVASASGGETGLVAPSGRSGRVFLDLHEANRRQLVRSGLDPSEIHLAPWCTCCRGDLLFSHRREGGAAGRQMAVVGRKGSLTTRPR